MASRHHFLWPGCDYKSHHEKALRGKLVYAGEFEEQKELHAQMQAPKKPDRGIVLTLLDHLELNPEPPIPNAIERLYKLGSDEAVALADHFVEQLGYFGIAYGTE